VNIGFSEIPFSKLKLDLTMLSPFTQKFIFFLTIPLVLLAFLSLSNIQKNLHQNAIEQLKGHMLELVEHQASEITGQLDRATAIAETTANAVGIAHPVKAENLYRMLKSNLNQLPIIYGSAIAYEKYSYKDTKLFAPYVYKQDEKFKYLELAKDAYDYTDKQWQWWHGPRDLGKGIWTAPYFDEGAGNTLMVTYSAPFFSDKRFIGVSTVDIDLSKLQKTLKLESLKEIQYIILTNTGHFAYHYKKSLIGQSYIDLANKLGLKQALVLGKEMIAGESGFYEINHNDKKEWIFYAPIGHYGWSFAIRTSEEAAQSLVNHDTNDASIWLLFIVILGLGLTHFVSKATVVKPLENLKEGVISLDKGDASTLKKGKFPSLIKEIASLVLQHHTHQVKSLAKEIEEKHVLQETLDEKLALLRKNRRRLKGFLNAARNPTINIDPAGEILLANEKFKKLINRPDLNTLSMQSLVDDEHKKQISALIDRLFKEIKVEVIEELTLLPFEAEPIVCKVIFTPIILEENDIEASIIFLVKENV